MSFDDFLSQTCVIKRSQPVGTDRYNNAAELPQAIESGVRCRLTFKNMRLVDQNRGENTWVNVPLILLPAGTDVQTGDQVFIDGEATGWSVTAPVLTRKAGNVAHHVSVIVEKINAQA